MGYTRGDVTDCVNNGALDVTAEGIGDTGSSGSSGDGSIDVDVDDESGVDNPTHSIYVGGVAGLLLLYSEITDSKDASFLDCHNRADVKGHATTNQGTVYLGGVLGGMLRWYSRNVVMERCSNTGDLTAGADRASIVGGLAGKIDVAVDGSINTGGQNIGSATFTRCYNAGTVDANGQKGVGIGGITGGLGDGATISTASTAYCYLTGCVTNAGGTTENNSGASKSANEMTEDYTWATDAYLGLGETNWEKQANDLRDENNLIGYLPVLQNNKQDPAPQLQRTVAEEVEVTITGEPDAPISVGGGPITLTATVTGTYSTLYWTIGSQAVARASGTSTGNSCIFEITGPGTAVITAVAYDTQNEIVGSGFVTLEVYGSPVSAVTISGLTAPVQGAQPVAAASVAPTAYYTLNKIEWTGTLDGSGLFKIGERYTAVITLSPKAGCAFEDSVTVTLAGIGAGTCTIHTEKSGEDLVVQAEFGPLAHTHKWASYWSYDESGCHWHNCLNPGCDITENSQKNGYEVHSDATFLWRQSTDGTEHYLKCYTCGATFCVEAHSSDEWQVDTKTNQHYQICDTCGKIFNQGEHEADTTEWLQSTDDNGNGYHYHICVSCGAEVDVEEHSLKTDGTLVGGEYRYWQKSDTEHWRECEVCGEFDRAAHDIGYVENNALTHRAGCPVCGYVTGTQYLPHVDNNGDHVCDDCGASIGYLITFYDSDGTSLGTGYTDSDGKLTADQWPDPGDAPGGKVFIGWYNNNSGTGGTQYTVDSKFTYSCSLYPRWGDYHTVTVEETENGTVSASQTAELVVNDTVILTITPEGGYRLKSGTLQVIRNDTGASISCREQTDGTYTFAMPDADVAVSAQFEACPQLYFIDPPRYIFMGLSQSVNISYEGTGYVFHHPSGSGGLSLPGYRLGHRRRDSGREL